MKLGEKLRLIVAVIKSQDFVTVALKYKVTLNKLIAVCQDTINNPPKALVEWAEKNNRLSPEGKIIIRLPELDAGDSVRFLNSVGRR